MAGGKGAHVGSQFSSRSQMKRALGIPWNHKMGPVKKMRGQDRRRGTWWNRELNCIAIEGQDFVQDTQEGGAGEFEFIPDSDEGAAKGSSSPLLDNDEYVPEMEPQDVVSVSKIPGSCANQGFRSLGSMLHYWLEVSSDVEMDSDKPVIDSLKLEKSGMIEMDSDKPVMCAKVQMGSVKLEKESVKVEVERDKFKMCSKVQMGTVKLQESGLVEMDSGKEEPDRIVGFSDLDTDDETCCFQDSQVEDYEVNDEKGWLVVFVIKVRSMLSSATIRSCRWCADCFLGLLVDHLNQMDDH